MKNEYVKVWVWDEALGRVQTKLVLYGTRIARWYGREPVYRYAHDILWDSEAHLAERANDFFDFYYFSGDTEHLKKSYWAKRVDEFLTQNVNQIYAPFVEENYNIPLSNSNPAAMFRIKGLTVE